MQNMIEADQHLTESSIMNHHITTTHINTHEFTAHYHHAHFEQFTYVCYADIMI